ncbi:phosphopantetheine-binding protein, partial [Amycolatopsis sp. NPDC000673]
PEDCHEELRARLPAYMLPDRIVLVDALPTTAGGKPDRLAVAALEAAEPDRARPYRAPRTGTEQEIVRIWERVLSRSRIGAEDDFFRLGGESLLAMRVLAGVRGRWAVEVSMRDFFRNSTPARLAALVDDRLRRGDVGPSESAEMVPAERTAVHYAGEETQ